MKKFQEFVKDSNLEVKMNEAAVLLSQQDVEPLDWILNWSKQYPVLETVLLEDLNNFDTLLMENMPLAQAPTFGQMAKNVGSAIGDYFSGPERRFNAAVRSIDWLKRKVASIPGNEQFKTSKGEVLSNWLNNIMQELGAQAQQLPKLMQRYEQQKAQQNQQPQQQNSPQVGMGSMAAPTQAPTPAAAPVGMGSMAPTP